MFESLYFDNLKLSKAQTFCLMQYIFLALAHKKISMLRGRLEENLNYFNNTVFWIWSFWPHAVSPTFGLIFIIIAWTWSLLANTKIIRKIKLIPWISKIKTLYSSCFIIPKSWAHVVKAWIQAFSFTIEITASCSITNWCFSIW